MAPTVLVWLCLLHCLLPFGNACLQCDPLVQLLHKNFLQTLSKKMQKDLRDIISHASITFIKTSQSLSGGTIDSSALFNARMAYRTEFAKFLDEVSLRREQDPEFLTSNDLKLMTKNLMGTGKSILWKHLKAFNKRDLCPNTCGWLYHTVLSCISCDYVKMKCSSPLERFTCGERHLEAEEGSYVVLDCYFPWHNLAGGEYQFSRYSDPSDDFIVFSASSLSSVVLNQVKLDDQGLYECNFLDSDRDVLTSLTYQLTVKPSPPTISKPVPTLPTLPPDDSSVLAKDLVIALVATVTALGLAGSFALAVVFGLALKREQREVLQERRKDEFILAEDGMLLDRGADTRK